MGVGYQRTSNKASPSQAASPQAGQGPGQQMEQQLMGNQAMLEAMASQANTNACVPSGIIDRIEGSFAVVETVEGDFVDVETSKLPSGVQEGDSVGEACDTEVRSGVVDRIEGAFAVIEDGATGSFIDVPVSTLGPDITEGASVSGY